LFAARRCVQQCGGTIRLGQPADGPGTTATIRIPRHVPS
jgi:signal transduction histidine kinase